MIIVQCGLRLTHLKYYWIPGTYFIECLTICCHIISLYIGLASGGTDQKAGDLFPIPPQRKQEMSPKTAEIRSRILSDAAGTSSPDLGLIFFFTLLPL